MRHVTDSHVCLIAEKPGRHAGTCSCHRDVSHSTLLRSCPGGVATLSGAEMDADAKKRGVTRDCVFSIGDGPEWRTRETPLYFLGEAKVWVREPLRRLNRFASQA